MPREVDVCVVGLGVSSLSLVRLLAAGEQSYAVLSDRDFGVWAEAARRGEDFDLLSSSATASFSWWEYDDDFHFFSASEYYQRLCDSVPESAKSHIIRMRAQSYVEQEDGRFAVHGTDGPVVVCKHLVITPGHTLSIANVFDMMDEALRLQNKTVLIEGYGDTTNMVMARLMLGGNRVIFSTRHFLNLDKVVWLPENKGKPRMGPFEIFEEYQHLHENNHERSNYAAWHATVPPYHTSWLSRTMRRRAGIDELVRVDDFTRTDIPHPVQSFLTRKGVSAGWGYPVKYWPVDTFFAFYDGGYKEKMLTHRMLLNDTFFFMGLGRVRVVHADRVAWESDDVCTIDGERVHVDVKMTSERAFPRPVEVTLKDGTVYTYRYCTTLHGIWSAERPNLYFVGGERPTTGAFAGTTEMQCEFIHRLITRDEFRRRMIRDYRANYESWQYNYLGSGTGYPGLEHTQFTGVTNNTLAKLMGVDMPFWSSLRRGRLAEYVAGTCLPARYPAVTGVEDAYFAFCEKWTNQFLVEIVLRHVYLIPFALNVAVLGMAQQRPSIAVGGLALLAPVTQKFMKCCLIGVVSHGPMYGDLTLVSVVCLVANLFAWLFPARLPSRLSNGWCATALRSGIPLMLCTAAARLYVYVHHGRLLFNDLRERKQYEARYEEYLRDVKSTTWYQRYLSRAVRSP